MMKSKRFASKAGAGSKPASMMTMQSVAACSSRDSLESKFREHRMSKKKGMEFLIKAMGISAISYSKGYPSIEDRYDAVVGTFLSGVWKRNYSSWKQG